MKEVLKYTVTVGDRTVELSDALTPGAVVPGVEVVRNSERSLNGTMTVDVVGTKNSFELLWSLLRNDAYLRLMRTFPLTGVVRLTERGTRMTDAGEIETVDRTYECIVDSVSYKPVVYNELMWQDVDVKLVEK